MHALMPPYGAYFQSFWSVTALVFAFLSIALSAFQIPLVVVGPEENK
jgi:hypothetical protein